LSDNLPVGVETLRLIVASPSEVISLVTGLIVQMRRGIVAPDKAQELLELIETILVYKLPNLSREQIEAMFSIGDLKQTRVYQEALEEGIEQGKLAMIPRLSALGLSVEQIAGSLEMEIEQVRQVLTSVDAEE
jgi:predicted transposase/invertase (TIGR01784 family)